jgi:[ribosomal protein S18]-alanine N-acetyltransferase
MSMDVREARPHDWLAIEALHHRAHRAIPRLWWWEEHLARAPFILIEDTGIAVGALFAWPDESPVAWVRLAALDDTLEVNEWLVLALPPVVDRLRRMGTRTLAWMDYGGWAGPYLGAQGFQRLDKVMTLAKSNRTLPQVNGADARIRLASEADIPAIVTVDRAAFTPHWWHSEATLRRRAFTSPYFAVAEQAGKVVAYAEATLHLPTAHLNRIAVHPAHQHHGIGAALLHDAVCAFWRYGAKKVTLNTQTHNRTSQRLYRRFGFEPTGDSLTVWELHL